ncbi:hypothetical protein ACFXTI_038594 [Malus domestica]
METPKEGKKQMKISTINGEEEAHSQYAMQLVSRSVLSMVLKASHRVWCARHYTQRLPRSPAFAFPNSFSASISPQPGLRYHLKDAVLLGGLPFSKGYGKNVVAYIGRDERFALRSSLCFANLRKSFASGIEHTAGDIFVRIPKGNAIFMKFDVYLMNTNAMGKENSERITKVWEKKQDFQTFELLVPLFKNM